MYHEFAGILGPAYFLQDLLEAILLAKTRGERGSDLITKALPGGLGLFAHNYRASNKCLRLAKLLY